MMLSKNLLFVSFNAHSNPSAYVNDDSNKSFTEDVVNPAIKANILGTKGITILIFYTGCYM